MIKCNTISEALQAANKKLEKIIDYVLDESVSSEIRNVEIETIGKIVYGAYEPVMYERRGGTGGLLDRSNIKHSVKDGVLTVVNKTPANYDHDSTTGEVFNYRYKNLPYLIEYGNGAGRKYFYDYYKQGAAYLKPRPFTAKTIENLKISKSHIKAMKGTLKRMNFKVE